MKIKKEYLFLACVIVALATYLVVGKDNDPYKDLPQIAALDDKNINRMVITQNNTPLELVKKDEQWFILPKDYPADPIKIKNMVKAAANLTISAVVSESGNYKRYDLEGAKRITVQIFGDNEAEREFSIGRAAPTPNHTFVQLAEDTNVYHGIGKLTTTFGQTLANLRDKTTLSFEKESITSLQIEKGDTLVTLTKTEAIEEAKVEGQEDKSAPTTRTQWQSATGSAISHSTVKSLLGSLSGLKCDDYMDDGAKNTLKNAAWTVTLKSDSDQWTLSTFAGKEADATQIPGISSFNKYAFLLSKSRVDAIEKQIDTLLNPSPQK